MNQKYLNYIISYNDYTFNSATATFRNYKWARVVNIETTKYLENVMYDSWLLDNKDEWINYDYVGSMSWKANTKINLPDLDNNSVQDRIITENPDVVAFYHFNCNLVAHATYWHTNSFINVWRKLLQEVGISESKYLDSNIIPFFGNYWMAKPNVMIDYINFFQKIKDVMENCKELYNEMMANSRYHNYVSTDRLMQIFDRPYYPVYIFVLERLPCVYFYQQYKILRY